MKVHEQIVDFGSHVPLTSIFSQNLNTDKAIMVGIEFNVLAGIIYSATCIPNHDDTQFKGMELSLDDYKMFLKPNVRETFEHGFPFRHLLNEYSPLMKLIMNYFTCEGRLSRLYRYHVMLLMHFTSTRTLNLCNFLSKSVLKMAKKIHTRGEPHITNLFHNSLIKIVVMDQLLVKQITWETFLDKLKTAPIISPTVSPSK